MSGTGEPQISDVLIAGGGQVGLALALALRRFAPRLSVTLVDAAAAKDAERAGRASTIAAGGQRMLAALGVWDEVAAAAEPVTEMIVTDSRTRDVVRPVYITIATAKGTGDASAYVVPDGAVVRVLRRAAEEAGARIVAPAAVTDFIVGDGRVTAKLKDGTALAARLLVAADGGRSRLRELAGIGTVGHGYGQSGIVVTVAHAKPHGGRAEEHFLPGGPFAILPLKGNRSSLVWTEPTDRAERLVAGDGLTFAVELERRFGHRLGAMETIDTPRAFPLSLSIARQFVAPRFALTGDAAHSIHPIAGQGLNLGYRDVAALAETIVEAHRLGLDIGSLTVLERYQRWRRFDTAEMALVTDTLNALFSNDNPGLRIARDVGLGVVDRLGELKRLFVSEASGSGAGEVPRLMLGEAI